MADNAVFKAQDPPISEPLPYPLWSDLGKELALYYGAASSESQPFANRLTVVLNPDGTLVLVYEPTSPLYLHSQDVLDDITALMGL